MPGYFVQKCKVHTKMLFFRLKSNVYILLFAAPKTTTGRGGEHPANGNGCDRPRCHHYTDCIHHVAPVCTPSCTWFLGTAQVFPRNGIVSWFSILQALPLCLQCFLPSVLWRCWLGGRKGVRPVKNCAVECWRGYLSGVRCRLAYGPDDATATLCFSEIQIGFTFLLLAHLGSLWQRAINVGGVGVFVCVCSYFTQHTQR